MMDTVLYVFTALGFLAIIISAIRSKCSRSKKLSKTRYDYYTADKRFGLGMLFITVFVAIPSLALCLATISKWGEARPAGSIEVRSGQPVPASSFQPIVLELGESTEMMPIRQHPRVDFLLDIEGGQVLAEVVTDTDRFSFLFEERNGQYIMPGHVKMPDGTNAVLATDGKIHQLKAINAVKLTGQSASPVTVKAIDIIAR